VPLTPLYVPPNGAAPVPKVAGAGAVGGAGTSAGAAGAGAGTAGPALSFTALDPAATPKVMRSGVKGLGLTGLSAAEERAAQAVQVQLLTPASSVMVPADVLRADPLRSPVYLVDSPTPTPTNTTSPPHTSAALALTPSAILSQPLKARVSDPKHKPTHFFPANTSTASSSPGGKTLAVPSHSSASS
jgi:hypothetical protein